VKEFLFIFLYLGWRIS